MTVKMSFVILLLILRGVFTMEKNQLLARISKLAALAHSEDLNRFALSEQAINEINAALETMTEEYVATYC